MVEQREVGKQPLRTKEWVVQPGDTAWEISERFGLTVEKLTQVNKTIPDILYPGDILLVPEDARERPIGWTFQATKAKFKGVASYPGAKFFDVFPPPRDADEYRCNYRMLLNGLREVETSFIMPAPKGDDGRSIGPLQISTEYHTDAWWQANHAPKYESCEELDYAERTVINYWLRWCPWALEFGDLETLARTHNGGPQYWQFLSTTTYWRKVRIAMKRWGYHEGFPEFRYLRRKNEIQPLFSAQLPFPCYLSNGATETAAVGAGTGALLAVSALDLVDAGSVHTPETEGAIGS